MIKNIENLFKFKKLIINLIKYKKKKKFSFIQNFINFQKIPFF